MLDFQTYIVESNSNAAVFKKAKGVARFIENEKRRTNFVAAMDRMIEVANGGEIYNAEYKDLYSYAISLALEKSFDDIKLSYVEQRRSEDWNYDIDGMFSINSIKKFVKFYMPMKARYPKIAEFLSFIEGLTPALKEIKAQVKSGRPERAPKPGEFIKPMPKREAVKQASDFLGEAVGGFKKEYSRQVKKAYFDALKKIKEIGEITDPKKDIPEDDLIRFVATQVIKRRGREYVIVPNSISIVNKLANHSIDNVIEKFVAKNVSKLANIFEKKREVKSHKINRTNVRNGLIENSMFFEFADGSSFIIYSSVVYKWKLNGAMFLQFPTRFSNVKMSDGSQMKTPSEEKMIKEF